MQLAPSLFARLNPFTIFLTSRYGGSHKGHQNSLELFNIMKAELGEVIKIFFKSYYCIRKIT